MSERTWWNKLTLLQRMYIIGYVQDLPNQVNLSYDSLDTAFRDILFDNYKKLKQRVKEVF